MWKIEETKYDKELIKKNGNRFIIGNGYLGYRGTLDEDKKEKLVALNIPGLYDQQIGKWVETVNAPNFFYTYLKYKDKVVNEDNFQIANHTQTLDLYNGVFSRKTDYIVDGVILTILSKRFLCYDKYNYAGYEYSISTSDDINLEIYTGIDLDVWDINGPHTTVIKKYNKDLEIKVELETIEEKHKLYVSTILQSKYNNFISVSSDLEELKKATVILKKNETFSFKRICYLTYDAPFDYKYQEYNSLLFDHKRAFNNEWNNADVIIDGDDLAQIGIRTSIYHLLIIAPRYSNCASISARGVSGQVYKGACFWDTEIFMLPFYLLTNPKVAKTLINYRINCLNEAINKAKEFGFEGAFYPWESVKNGLDACTFYNVTDVFTNRPIRTYFKDKQIHISGDVVYGINSYIEYTKDYEILYNGALEVLIEVVNFYNSYMFYSDRLKQYVILDVTGPDEYHERVNNNAFTNKLIEFSFNTLLKYMDYVRSDNLDYYNKIVSKYKIDLERISFISKNIFQKKDNEEYIIEQFDNYFKLEDISINELLKRRLDDKEYLGGANGIATSTKIIKQADVVTMLHLFKDDFSLQVKKANYDYYSKRTEHGSSLSACMYSLLACEIDEPDFAYQDFLNSSLIDYYGKGKEYAGNIYIGGTHPASNGGAYMGIVYGFAGIDFKNGNIVCKPSLPEKINRLSFKVHYLNDNYTINISKEKVDIIKE